MADTEVPSGDEGWPASVPGGGPAARHRAAAPAAAARTFLNTGAAGPLLAPAAEALRRSAAAEERDGRAAPDALPSLRAAMSRLRSALGVLLGVGHDEVALTHNTTEGINIVVWGLPWQPGDRVVTTTQEHPGALVPLYQLHRRRGVTLDFVDLGAGHADEVLAAFRAALERPCALVVLSHVTYSAGARLPIGEIARLAHERGALVLVDGAQAVGAIPVDVAALGADFYAMPGQKWLCGPEGTGALVVRRAALDRLAPTFVGFLSADLTDYRTGEPDSLTFAAGAARYEVGSRYRPGIEGLTAAVDWHRAHPDIPRRIADLASYCRAQAARLPGAQVLTPARDMAGLVSVRIGGVDLPRCVESLHARGVTIRAIPEQGSLRLSCGFFNTETEVDRALALIEDCSRHAHAGP